ncbi:MAG: hypothetical protein M3O35_09630, partial [Acidobacteriota bacterium]|nr:hypothetical protein [Acidobacteriota bacterium]
PWTRSSGQGSRKSHGGRQTSRLDQDGDENVRVDNYPDHFPDSDFAFVDAPLAPGGGDFSLYFLRRQFVEAVPLCTGQDFSSQSGGGANVFT